MEDTVFQEPGPIRELSQSRKKQKPVVLFVVILLILAGIFFGASRFLGSDKKEEVTPTPTPTSVAFPTDTPTPTTDVSPTSEKSQTPTPTQKAASSLDKTSGLDRATVTIAVENGSGQVGAASKMADSLKALGYKIASTGNADNFDYQDVTISVKSDKKNLLSLLKKDLAATYTVGDTSTTLSASTSADALVIIGK